MTFERAVAQTCANSAANARPRGFAYVPNYSPGVSVTFFAASDGVTGVELYGTTAFGTGLAADVNPGRLGSYPDDLTVMEILPGVPALFYTARQSGRDRELHLMSSTTSGRLDLRPGPLGSNPHQLTVVGQNLFFTADDGSGRSLWRYDPTSLPPGPKKIVGNFKAPHELTALGSMLLFAAEFSGQGVELGAYDTTTSSLTVIDIHSAPTTDSSHPKQLVKWGSHVYFVATRKTEGRELWRTDGTPSGTSLFRDVVPGPGSSHPEALTPDESSGSGLLAFTAADGGGRELWTTDSSPPPATATRRTAFPRGETISWLTPMSSAFYFAVEDAGGKHLWRWTTAGVTQVTKAPEYPASCFPRNLQRMGDRMVFRAYRLAEGHELHWTTGAGASIVKDLRTGNGARGQRSSFASPFGLADPSQSTFVFAANSPGRGIELWKTNGKPETTLALPEIRTDQADGPELHLQADKGLATTLTIALDDAVPNQPWYLLFTLPFQRQSAPIAYTGITGCLMVEPPPATLVWPDVTGPAGFKLLTIPVPSLSLGPLVFQALALNANPSPAVTWYFTGNTGCSFNRQATTGGVTVTVPEGCIDDETGEYRLSVYRDNLNASTPAWLALVRPMEGGTEYVFVDDDDVSTGDPVREIGAGEAFDIEGTFDAYLPETPGDPPGAKLILLLFTGEPPNPGNLSTGVLVWDSYC